MTVCKQCLGELKIEGVDPSCKLPGVHDPLEPEYSILKQRLARRVRYERMNVKNLTLPSLTKLAERTITDVSAQDFTRQSIVKWTPLLPT